MREIKPSLVVAGINFKKTAIEIRNKFALTQEHIQNIYMNAEKYSLKDFFILSTCNRTEIYTASSEPGAILNLFVENSGLSVSEVEQYFFVKSGDEAVKHLFRVAAGLDSQILGDYEIVGQLRKAFSLAKSVNCVGGFIEKIVNSSLSASKEIKQKTSLSDGTTSVSYTVIQLLKQISTSEPLNICLIGLGKIGTLTLKNLKQYLPQHKIIVVNRDESKAQKAAGEYLVEYAAFNQKEAVKNADVLIVATGADKPIIFKEDILSSKIKTIFDLSVPSNISHEVKEINDITIFNIDELSQMVNQTIETRRNQIPSAEAIIQWHFNELKDWEERRKLYKPKEETFIPAPGSKTLISLI